MLKVEGSNFDWKNIPLGACLEGNALDAYYTAKIYGRLLEEVRAQKLEKLYEKLISPLSSIFAEMEYNGMLIDENELDKLGKELEELINYQKELLLKSDRIPEGMNLSGHDLLKILFSLEKDNEGKWEQITPNIGFGLYPLERTKTGQPATSEEVMDKISDMVTEEFIKRGLNEKV